ncbi:MAG: FAD-dependent oxidoreductase [Deltaproteobacteria bacterium HGW-Deltaproteobacteria-10]|nr:MAG: FAD-dependent oxidoreductase [Deltaproteobacteria bacterium HGW-Deltaproteobacteria-2]PKN64425.1 MAG: FAD-dependent oxidoreductase [Deltaproteobacteria bacterium HGW-Deltaproteobacteria-10]
MGNSTEGKRPRVVIIGGGFGGLWAARTLADQPVNVLLIDHNNYHTFLALLYQVAAAELTAEDIAYPVRSIFTKTPNLDFILAHARRIDLQNRQIETDGESIPYDYLILASGSVTSTFGVSGVEENAYFLKTLEEAVALKNHIICCFETAAREPDAERRKSLLTFVIVGGGATGVEYSGALTELIHGPLIKDYHGIDFSETRIILLEAAEQLVSAMPANIRDYAARQLREMGVDVRLKSVVAEVFPDRVVLKGADNIETNTVVWTAGVKGEGLAAASNIPVTRDGRVTVSKTLQIQDQQNIYVIGDLASISESHRVLPMVAQVAIQSGVTSAQNILRQIRGSPPQPFVYKDRGSMITIGRKAAGVAIGSRTFTGFFAWVMWLVIHLFNLIGFRNRVMVLINWAWDYLLYERAVRYVFPSNIPSKAQSSSCIRGIRKEINSSGK